MRRPTAVLISGRGSNMAALLDAAADPSYPARIDLVLSNRPEAAGLRLAQAAGIATAVVDHRAFRGDRTAFEAALTERLEAAGVEILALAGFLRVLTAGFVARWQDRLVNIHPSLLPAFPGLHTHRRALEAGCKVAGATVHFVTPELDHGPIVMQSVVPVLPGDDEPALAARVLATEHLIYPRSVRWFVQGRLSLEGGVVRQRDGESQLLRAGG
jgi:phosphoribosylglycinamide formyltransferase-1